MLDIRFESIDGFNSICNAMPMFHRKPMLKDVVVVYEQCIVSEMFDDNHLSLIALNLFRDGYGLCDEVSASTFQYQSERWCIVKVDGYEYTSVGRKVFKEKC